MARQATSRPPTDLFDPTRWSVVLTAADSDVGSSAHRALSELCNTYWYPVYVYLRRKGYKEDEAEDLAQGFFAHLLAKKIYASADPHRGKFRAFLITVLKNYLHNIWQRGRAQKRGAGVKPVALDAIAAEQWYTPENDDAENPDTAFDREWAHAVVRTSLERLRQEYSSAGREALFEQLQNGIANAGRQLPQAELAGKLGMTEDAVKSALKRLRKRFRKLLREEIRQTTANPEDVDGEIRYLLDCLHT